MLKLALWLRGAPAPPPPPPSLLPPTPPSALEREELPAGQPLVELSGSVQLGALFFLFLLLPSVLGCTGPAYTASRPCPLSFCS